MKLGTRILSSFLAVPLVMAPLSDAHAVQEAPSDSVRSPALRRLQEGQAADLPRRLATFWTDTRARGLPIVEAAPQADHRLVSFVYRGGDSITNVRLDAAFITTLARSVHDDAATLGRMIRMPGTDLWYLTLELRTDLRAPYRFLVSRRGSAGVERRLDESNSRSLAPGTQWARSILELPHAPPQPWRTVVPKGTWREVAVTSAALGGERMVHVYLPAGYRPDRPEPYPVLIGMDSYGYRDPLMPVDRVLEYLAAQQRIPETVLILTEDVGPIGDAGGYDPVVAFLADEVLPAVRKTIRISSDPANIIASGMSRRGLVASYAAFRRPDVIGKVLSLSGSYYWRPPGSLPFEWLPNLFAVTERQPIRLYLSAGLLETSVSDANSGHYLLGTNRHMRDVLAARGYDFRYEEFMGGHSEVNWEDQLVAGLTWLWARR
jgi:enterochelin esterase family protein